MPRNIFGTWKNCSRIKVLATCIVVCAALAAAAFLGWRYSRSPEPVTASAPQPPDAAQTPGNPQTPGNAQALGTQTPSAMAAAEVARPSIAAEQASVASIIQVVVGRNDTLDAIFRRMSLNKSDLAAIRNLPGIRQSLDFLKPGDSIKLTHTDGDIKELTRKVSETQTLDVVLKDSGFEAKMIDNPVETRVRTARAVIDSSLFQAAGAADISDTVALKLANVFAWDIDFVLDIREGDRFTAVYEQIFQDGKYLHDGEVLAAEFVNNGKVYRAVRFVGDDGHAGYYTPAGLAMRKAFLRAPVEFTRVSSAFNPHRQHPILNLIRGHMGTDYAAPIGTPVHAAGDGHVSFAGQRGGYGNAIVLTHGANVSTLYGHMSRFARNIHVGTRVQQGEVIGFVGMTGLATGPHLHYEYLTGGVHRNPQTVQLPGAEPLRAQDLQTFREKAAPLLADLSPPQPAAAVAAVAPSGAASAAGASSGAVPAAGSARAAAATSPAAVPSGAAEPRSKTSAN
ncbi:MAG TPA: peptidoglycan DD-metalloendopeptidase family protein [Steroidobacteraceae bacterium]|nr:peptidoglycan DD-metalloendopeptidase family protein [Steroidobacteraceae bacterium]